jgi:hypothetical protein
MLFGCFGFGGAPDVRPKDSGEFRHRIASCRWQFFQSFSASFLSEQNKWAGVSPEKAGCT